MSAVKAMKAHRCRPGSRPTGVFGPDRPAWGEPGQLVKVSGEEKWGRVAYRMQCCGEYIVEFAPQEDGQDPETGRYRVDHLENTYAAYPANLPPKGYMIPHWSRAAVPSGGGVEEA